MKRRNPLGSRATRLLAYENARLSESRRSPFWGRARKDSAVRVSLSSNHNVKEPLGVKRMPHSRTPDGSKSSIRSQRQPKRLSRIPDQAPPLSATNAQSPITQHRSR